MTYAVMLISQTYCYGVPYRENASRLLEWHSIKLLGDKSKYHPGVLHRTRIRLAYTLSKKNILTTPIIQASSIPSVY